MRSLNLVPLLIVALAAQASASGILTVRSNARADIFLDNEHVGRTPMTITQISAGNHNLTLVDPSTDHSRIYSFNVPRRVDTAREIDATFRASDPPRLVVGSALTTVAAPQDDGYRYRSTRADPNEHINTSRNKVRIRNTALGVGAVGAIVGSTPLAILGFGGAAVNELTNH